MPTANELNVEPVRPEVNDLDLDVTELDARLEMASIMPDSWWGGGQPYL